MINATIYENNTFSEEVANYLNSHPAFAKTEDYLIEPFFFNEYISKCLSDEPIAFKYRQAIWDQRELTMDEAVEFLKWLDPKWMEYNHLSESTFFKSSKLMFANDGVEFMDI